MPRHVPECLGRRSPGDARRGSPERPAPAPGRPSGPWAAWGRRKPRITARGPAGAPCSKFGRATSARSARTTGLTSPEAPQLSGRASRPIAPSRQGCRWQPGLAPRITAAPTGPADAGTVGGSSPFSGCRAAIPSMGWRGPGWACRPGRCAFHAPVLAGASCRRFEQGDPKIPLRQLTTRLRWGGPRSRAAPIRCEAGAGNFRRIQPCQCATG